MRGVKTQDYKVYGQKFNLKCFIFGHKCKKRHTVNFRGTGLVSSSYSQGTPEITVYAECKRCGAITELYRNNCEFDCPKFL